MGAEISLEKGVLILVPLRLIRVNTDRTLIEDQNKEGLRKRFSRGA